MKELFLVTGVFDRFYGGNNKDKVDESEYNLEEYQDLLIEYKASEADILINIATIYFQEEEITESLVNLDKAIEIYDEIDFTEKKALVLDIMGDIKKYNGDVTKALNNYREALKLYTAISDTDHKDELRVKIKEIEDQIKIEENKNKYSVKLPEHLPPEEVISSDYNFIQEDVENVISILSGANTYLSYTKAKKPMKELENAYEMSNGIGDVAAKATLLTIMGDTSLKELKPLEALDQFKKALENFKEINDKTGEAVSMLLIGTAYYIIGDMDKVPDNFRKSIEILRSLKDVNGEEIAIKLMNTIYEE
jgi:tetratricopeptide (TPR) repeat protein